MFSLYETHAGLDLGGGGRTEAFAPKVLIEGAKLPNNKLIY